MVLQRNKAPNVVQRDIVSNVVLDRVRRRIIDSCTRKGNNPEPEAGVEFIEEVRKE